MDPTMKRREAILSGLLVRIPRHLVDPWGGSSLKGEERGPENVHADVMQERCQSFLVVPVDSFSYAVPRL
jgi:hypothetical protein